MSGQKPTAISGEYRARVAGARQGRGLRLAWACRRSREASRSIIGRSGNSSMARAELKKIVAAGERDHPDIATRGCSGASIKTASSLRVRFSSTRPGPSSRTIPGSCKAIRQFIRVAGVKLFFLPKIRAGPALDRADDSPSTCCARRRTLHRNDLRRSCSSPRCICPDECAKLFPNFSGYA